MVVVTVLPFSPSVRSSGVPKSFSTFLTYSTSGSIDVSTTLSLAGTFTTVSVDSFVRTGFPTVGVISPVVGFTLYVVVIVSSPSSPLTVVEAVPFSFVLSFS